MPLPACHEPCRRAPRVHARGFSLVELLVLIVVISAALAGYGASVAVAPAALNTLGAASGEALRITVTVTGPGGVSIALDGYRTRHAPNSSI